MNGNGDWKRLKDVRTGRNGDAFQGRWNEKSLRIEVRKKGGEDDWQEIDAGKLQMYPPGAQDSFKNWAKSQ